MDELEFLKKDWQKQDDSLPKVSQKEIYKMMLKKSSSIVKWIFIISLLEFLLLASVEIISRATGMYEDQKEFGLNKEIGILLSVISFGILIYFMTRFYINYRKIRVTDSVKILMENILNTRRTVKTYVFVNLTFATLMLLYIFGYTLIYSPEFQELQRASDQHTSKVILGVLLFIAIIIIIGIVGGIYYLLYGLLIRRLNKNYKELLRLEV